MKILIPIIILVVIFIIIYYYNDSKYEYMTGSCGLKYYVIDGPNKKCQFAADLLCQINNRCMRLIKHLKNKNTSGEKKKMIDKLIEEYDIDDLIENETESFTIGKGQKIHICMRTPDNGFLDLNTIMFVVIHELSHIVTENQNNPHTALYWVNNMWLMRESESIGIFDSIDYEKYPVKYCNNVTLNKNPLYDRLFIDYVNDHKSEDINIES